MIESAHHLSTLAFLGHNLAQVVAGAPDPGQGVAPPGSDKILTALQWFKWIFTALAVAGALGIAVGMVVIHRRGEDANLGKLGWWLAGCVLAGAAPSLITALS